MKIYILDPFEPTGVAYAAERAAVVRWDDPAVRGWHEDADGVMVRMSRLTRDDFARAKRLRGVCKQGVGIETIDLDAARDHGVVVCNTPGVNSEAVAELGLTLGLAVGRRVGELDRAVRAGGTVQRDRFLGREAWEKTVGIVGMGNIGTRVARKWHGAFGATLLGYDPYAPADRWSDLPHERVATLEAMLPRVDLLTVHCPLTAETRHMVGARELALMRPDAILVNVARGGIVDEAALFDALSTGRLFGAGLDVFETEPPTADMPLVGLPNVVSTPHSAASTRETQQRSSLTAAQQLLEVLHGRQPLSRVA